MSGSPTNNPGRIAAEPGFEPRVASSEQDPMVIDLAARITKFDRGSSLGDCLGDSRTMVNALYVWLALGLLAWAAFYLLELAR